MDIKAVVETAIYVDDLQATEAFYRTVLGLRVMGREPGHHVFFQVGEASVLLAFRAEATLKGDPLPSHGASGPGHFALGIAAESLDAWRGCCKATASPSRKWSSGPEAASPSTSVTLRGIWWNW